jgi:hypothetical protein
MRLKLDGLERKVGISTGTERKTVGGWMVCPIRVTQAKPPVPTAPFWPFADCGHPERGKETSGVAISPLERHRTVSHQLPIGIFCLDYQLLIAAEVYDDVKK